MSRVVVLGCGPSGLLAATAFDMAGHHTTVVSNKHPSAISGAQFLHEKIVLPFHYGYTPGDGDNITFEHRGTPEDYAQKVYGDPRMAHRVSFGTYESPRRAWQLHPLYRALWRVWEPKIMHQAVISAQDISANSPHYDYCVSTIPLSAICYKPEHSFTAQEIKIVDGIPIGHPEFNITYNGLPSQGWYRASNLWGHTSAEYRADSAPPGTGHRMWKPYAHNCDCYVDQPNIKLAGRYGKWKKGVLLDHVWNHARKLAEVWR